MQLLILFYTRCNCNGDAVIVEPSFILFMIDIELIGMGMRLPY